MFLKGKEEGRWFLRFNGGQKRREEKNRVEGVCEMLLD